MLGPAGYMVDGPARYMLGPAGYMVVAHMILVSAQVLLVLTLGLWTSDLGLTIIPTLLKASITSEGDGIIVAKAIVNTLGKYLH